jgi:hypothetical protein
VSKRKIGPLDEKTSFSARYPARGVALVTFISISANRHPFANIINHSCKVSRAALSVAGSRFANFANFLQSARHGSVRQRKTEIHPLQPQPADKSRVQPNAAANSSPLQRRALVPERSNAKQKVSPGTPHRPIRTHVLRNGPRASCPQHASLPGASKSIPKPSLHIVSGKHHQPPKTPPTLLTHFSPQIPSKPPHPRDASPVCIGQRPSRMWDSLRATAGRRSNVKQKVSPRTVHRPIQPYPQYRSPCVNTRTPGSRQAPTEKSQIPTHPIPHQFPIS